MNTKPETPNIRQHCKIVLKLLQERGRTRRELEIILFPTAKAGTKDRQVREIVSMLKKTYPIISLSNNKGYRMAKTLTDIEDAQHQLAENDSRIKELQAANRPLIDFCGGRATR
jgi:hypothetical protein